MSPAESIALTGQYFVAESSMQRRIASASTSGPMTSCVTVISGKICGYSSRCMPSTWTRYAMTCWRFFIAIEMTSIAEHDARAARTVSTGEAPRFDSRSSKS